MLALKHTNLITIVSVIILFFFFLYIIKTKENLFSFLQDLVAWVTIGVHHIPHTEDLPITPTVGAHRSFFLLPYNYFDEDPSMGSKNAIRFDRDNEGKVKIYRYGISNKHQCVGRQSKFDENVQKDPSLVFQTTDNAFY